jgi:hypothetical protein
MSTQQRPVLFSLLGAIIGVLALAADLRATTYYVSPTGKNSNPGTSAKPWASPAYGSRRMKSGDTLIIRKGRYIVSVYDDDIMYPPSGTSAAWTIIKGEDGARPVIAGRDDLFAAINLAGKKYIRVENIEITHDDQVSGEKLYFRTGITISGGPSSSIILDKLYIHHVDEGGIDMQDVQNVKILNSRIEYCGFGAVGGPAGEAGGIRNLLIQNCRLSYGGHYYQGTNGKDRPYDRPDGFGIEPSDGPIQIIDTRAEHNYGDGLDSKAKNTTIRRCIVANNSCDGVKLWAGTSLVENTLIYGRGDGNSTTTPWAAVVIGTDQKNATFTLTNVSVDDTLGKNYLIYVQYDETAHINLNIRNCIFRGIGTDCPMFIGNEGEVTLKADHNLFYLPKNAIVLSLGNKDYTKANIKTLGAGNRYGDPKYLKPAWGKTGDYHLKSGSPAINHGTATGAPTNDLDKKKRDTKPDIGAYEYVASGVK